METILGQLIAEVNKKRQALEEECKLLESLLKPWPRKKPQKNEENQAVKTTVNSVDTATTGLSHEEKQALLQVDELLRKAQKMRHLKSKEKSHMRPEISQDTKADIIESRATEHVDQASEPVSDSLTGSSRTPDIDSHRMTVRTEQFSADKPSKNISNSASEVAEQSKQPIHSIEKKRHILTGASSKPVTSDANVAARQQNYRPPSAGRSSRPLSGRGRHKPAHMSAPFKTDENIRFPKCKLNHIPAVHKSGISNVLNKPVPTGGKAYKTLPAIKSADQKKRSGTVKDDAETTGSMRATPETVSENVKPSSERLDASDDDSECLTVEKSVDLIPKSQKQDLTTGINSNQSAASDIQTSSETMNSEEGEEQLSETVHSICSDPQESERQWFSLRQSGSSLKVPGQLKKLVSINNSLRDRCSAAQLVKKVSPGDPAQLFVDKLDRRGEMGQELWTRFSALTCLRSHQILLDTLENLQLDQISECTSYEVILRAHRMLQFILSAFAEWQEEADYITKVQFRPLAPVKEMPRHEGGQNATSLFDTGESTGAQDDKDVWNYLQSSKHWTHLKFTERYLQLYILAVKAAQSEWWNILQAGQMDPGVLQGIYSLLTSRGQFLPAFVESPDFQ